MSQKDPMFRFNDDDPRTVINQLNKELIKHGLQIKVLGDWRDPYCTAELVEAPK